MLPISKTTQYTTSPRIQIIDAMMGSGKTTYVFKEIEGFYPEFTDTSKKPIVAQRSVYVEEKKV